MHGKNKGVGGRSVLRRVACPGPFQTQPADTSPGPQSAAGIDLALVSGYGLQSRPMTEDPYAAMARLIYGVTP